jgi:uncharacterized membrane protein
MPRVGLIVMALGYIAAGINHIWHPQFYIKIIPDYFPQKQLLNILSGIAEIGLGLLLFPKATRRWAAYGIIAMLIAFVPVHIWMIQQGGCYFNPEKCIPDWLLWVRLLVLQPLLILWAWSCRKPS